MRWDARPVCRRYRPKPFFATAEIPELFSKINAPTPVSAVLSGSMINTGLLGWIRFFSPGLGLGMEPAWGDAFLTAGLAAAFYGVLLGLTQSKPKTILTYSSISQTGLITAAFGLSLFEPSASLPAHQTVLLYAMHHGFAKGALFLMTRP